MKNLLFVVLLLSLALLGSIYFSQASDFTLRLLPPAVPPLPLQGTWEITAPLQQPESDAALPQAQNWRGQKIYIDQNRVLLGQYLLDASSYRVKRVPAQAYLTSQKQAFPEDFKFTQSSLDVITLADDHRFFCELIPLSAEEFILNLFSQSFYVHKIAATVEEKVFAGSAKTIVDLAAPAQASGIPTGLLLGLRRPHGDGYKYRTLWLPLSEQQLTLVLETEKIVFPRRSGFYELQIKSTATEDVLFAAKLPEEFETERLLQAQTETTVRRRLDYVGNDYISLCETYTVPDFGGKKKEKSVRKIVAVDSLPATPAVTMDELLGNKNLNMLAGAGAGEENFGLVRRNGYWIFQGRSFSYQEGQEKFVDFPLSIIPPNHLVFSNELAIPWPRVKNHVPQARDVLTSPTEEVAFVFTPGEILIYTLQQGNLAASPLQKIPLLPGEEIIMSEWALGHYVDNWTLFLQNFQA
ncbi:MAG: hypothetical protein GX197_04555 [Firmicutes bacterium]|nr:hypothetical protein [Bacillota bacterium]